MRLGSWLALGRGWVASQAEDSQEDSQSGSVSRYAGTAKAVSAANSSRTLSPRARPVSGGA